MSIKTGKHLCPIGLNSDQVDLAEAYCGYGHYPEAFLIQVRLEVYTVDEAVYQSISQSYRHESNHKVERDALVDACDSGSDSVARTNSVMISARSGNRAGVFQGQSDGDREESTTYIGILMVQMVPIHQWFRPFSCEQKSSVRVPRNE